MAVSLEIDQYGYTHLLYYGWRGVRQFCIACVKMGVYWLTFGLVFSWWAGRWQEITSIPFELLFGFGLGFVVRFVYEVATRVVEISETQIFVVCPGHYTYYPSSDVRQLVVDIVARDRVVLRIEWENEKRRPLTICGRVNDAESRLHDVKKYYTVVQR